MDCALKDIQKGDIVRVTYAHKGFNASGREISLDAELIGSVGLNVHEKLLFHSRDYFYTFTTRARAREQLRDPLPHSCEIFIPYERVSAFQVFS